MVFLLLFFISTLVHADHLAAEATAIEQQDCHICNQGIDTPAELPQIDAIVFTRYSLVTQAISTTDFSLNSFVQPPLRAPPFFSKD